MGWEENTTPVRMTSCLTSSIWGVTFHTLWTARTGTEGGKRGDFYTFDCVGQFVMTVMRTVSTRQLLQLLSIVRFISAHKMDSSAKRNVPMIIVDVLVGLVSYNTVPRVSFVIVMNRLATIHVWLMVGLVVPLNKYKLGCPEQCHNHLFYFKCFRLH